MSITAKRKTSKLGLGQYFYFIFCTATECTDGRNLNTGYW